VGVPRREEGIGVTSEFLTVPIKFAGRTINREKEAGRDWIEQLPRTVSQVLDDWDLTVIGPPMSGTVALVWEVSRADGTDCILKVGWRDVWSRGEAEALRRWSGRGAVKLIDSRDDVGALLMERLDSRTSLMSVEIDRAIDAAAGLLNLLHIPSRSGFDIALVQELEGPEATDKYRDRLLGLRPNVERAFGDSPHFLLHGDFHYENILRSGASWKAIDPKPALGPREWDLVPLLRNRFGDYPGGIQLLQGIRNRLDSLIAATGTDSRRAYLFAHYRALADADYAHRINDREYEDLSNAVAEATALEGGHDKFFR
jgi:streptomycin 6-kinase